MDTASLNVSCLKDARPQPHVEPERQPCTARQGHRADQPDLYEHGMAGTGPACAQTDGSRSYVRSRMVTLVGRLPGSFPVRRKLQERSDDPWHPWRSSGMMPRCLQ
jgi:hypothetical protein